MEYPQYTRPEVWEGRAVPPVLLTGDHQKIEVWRGEQSRIRTRAIAPLLLGFDKAHIATRPAKSAACL